MNTKICKKCGEDKPLSEWGKHKRRPDGLQSWCKACCYKKQREWLASHPGNRAAYYATARGGEEVIEKSKADTQAKANAKVLAATKVCPRCKEDKPKEAFHRNNFAMDGLQFACIGCMNAAKKARYNRDPEHRAKVQGQSKEWKKKQPPGKVAASLRNSFTSRKYGITTAEYNRLVAEAGGCCAICRKTKKRLVIDHEHTPGGKFRGLICDRCNIGLGYFDDNAAGLRAALDYLENKGRAFEPLTFIA